MAQGPPAPPPQASTAQAGIWYMKGAPRLRGSLIESIDVLHERVKVSRRAYQSTARPASRVWSSPAWPCCLWARWSAKAGVASASPRGVVLGSAGVFDERAPALRMVTTPVNVPTTSLADAKVSATPQFRFAWDQAAACERRSHSFKPMRPRRASPNGTSECSSTRPPQYRASGSRTTARGSPTAFR
jgi:hypothetical protein